MRIAFVGNQGGRANVEFYVGMARALWRFPEVVPEFVVWLDRECHMLEEYELNHVRAASLESWVALHPVTPASEVDALVRDYREVNWSEVVASERAFTDYSMLLGAAGDRREDMAYVSALMVRMTRFLEDRLRGCHAMVCQTADTVFALVAFKVARHLGVRAFAISPAWLLEPGKGGGFFASSEYLKCARMEQSFRDHAGRALTELERDRAKTILESIRTFSGKTAYSNMTSKGKSAGRRAVSPNLGRLFTYLSENAAKNKDVDYLRFDVRSRVKANLLRVARKIANHSAYGPTTVDDLPDKFVFYALHYQPEQSTLAQGIWYANQVSLVEDISKSLPLGYTLVVKEHPWGRGNRPVWQYRHMSGLYNVQFCDAPAKEIIRRAGAVVAVTGTVALEALVLDIPTVLLGRNFFEYCELFYRPACIQDLPAALAQILVERHYESIPGREDTLLRFLISYLDGLVPWFPLPEHAEAWGSALARELDLKC